ncbi:MAG: T9SS type A sorting domain-containing protein [Phaeodactylibacter xiamenensis]|uniref:Secretion system C-terminal sorting domain-containing protein n=1 Tax=Phaeodactylibacter xiamenensis TaxID=1524460 RepID=A0A098S239_9BACT|nr:T9SS type A sorting domain-containing protein [Phaeodactylibacter xiamenensis]KGE85833.1 hypothetical protein IX84_24720 [Phaeodactylibacter xiamenensis]MCR9053234.1 T9SS type A sorting domain-containing protein [bacterium]
MLKYCFTFLLSAFACCGLNAQCPPGDVILSSQAEVDAFVADYPDCTEIAGSMLIGSLSDPTDITDISGLSNLTSIGGNLDLLDNDSISSLAGLELLVSIDGDLNIKSNAILTSLSGFNQLTSINGVFSIIGNTHLMSLSGLEQLTFIGGDLLISGNPDLTNLTGFDQLNSIHGDLEISGNPNLTSLTGLIQLTLIGGDLYIRFNSVLTSLTELEQLTSIGGFLVISGNTELMSLAGLKNLDATTIDNLFMSSNYQLSSCAIESICNYLSLETNSANISGNATGCATREEVETACMVSATEISQANIKLFPNPTNGMLQLRNITAKEVVVYTAQGQRIARYDNPGQELDLSALPAGVYHLHLITADAVHAARVVKQ